MHTVRNGLKAVLEHPAVKLILSLLLFFAALLAGMRYAPWDPGDSETIWEMLFSQISLSLEKLLYNGINELRDYWYFTSYTGEFFSAFPGMDYEQKFFYISLYDFSGVFGFSLLMLLRKGFEAWLSGDELDIRESGKSSWFEAVCDFLADNFFAYAACVIGFRVSGILIHLAVGSSAEQFLSIMLAGIVSAVALLYAPITLAYRLFGELIDWVDMTFPVINILMILVLAVVFIKVFEFLIDLVFRIHIWFFRKALHIPLLWLIPAGAAIASSVLFYTSYLK